MRAGGLLLAALALAAGLRARSEQSTGAAATANPLQVVGEGARPLAMGSAFTAVKGDLMSGLFNPSGQAYLRGTHAALNHNAWIGGITQDSIAAVLAGRAISFGVYSTLVNYGAIEGTDESGLPTQSFTPTDFSLGLSLAKEFSNGLAVGGMVRGTQQSIKDSGQLLSAGDIGAMWAAKEMPVTLGVAYANLGPAGSAKASTTALRLGLAWDIPVTARSGVLLAVGGSGLNNGGSLMQLGMEGKLAGVAFIRAGYQVSFLDNQTGGMSGLSTGLGARLGSFVLDYAYLPYGRLGDSHRVSLDYEFNETAAAPTPKPAPAPAQQAPMAAPARPAPAAAGGSAVDMVFEVPSAEEAALRKAAEGAPGDAAAWRRLGRWCYDHKDRAGMLEAYDHVIKLAPEDTALKAWLDKVRAAR